jgi:hypothetical protein
MRRSSEYDLIITSPVPSTWSVASTDRTEVKNQSDNQKDQSKPEQNFDGHKQTEQ